MDSGRMDSGGMTSGGMTSGGMSRSDASALVDLQMHWDEAYVIGLDGDIWSARYRTSTDELRAHTSSELRELIRSDYAYRQKTDLATYDPDEDADEEDGEESLADDSAGAGEDESDDRSAGAGADIASGADRSAEDVNFAAIRGERMST
ncbi:MAG TPA: hypothetical protein VK802_13385 [Streptosporangiaceae bacterium]|jgi:hypothetical protein|nr:hypothetical protein [Streptosporangiaceae bacterium]